MKMEPGAFIVFEGLDGSGTSTQAGLLKHRLEAEKARRVYITRQPSNGPAGSLLQLALRKRITLDARSLALLFAADRMDHLSSDLLDKLDQGVTVICDRYYLSSFAYQLLDLPDDLAWLEQINAHARPPDLSLLLDVPAEVCMERIRQTRWHVELFEELDRLRAVRAHYLQIAEARSDRERIVVLDGNRRPDEVHEGVWAAVRSRFGF